MEAQRTALAGVNVSQRDGVACFLEGRVEVALDMRGDIVEAHFNMLSWSVPEHIMQRSLSGQNGVEEEGFVHGQRSLQRCHQ
jgi:hypothetical protein